MTTFGVSPKRGIQGGTQGYTTFSQGSRFKSQEKKGFRAVGLERSTPLLTSSTAANVRGSQVGGMGVLVVRAHVCP